MSVIAAPSVIIDDGTVLDRETCEKLLTIPTIPGDDVTITSGVL